MHDLNELRSIAAAATTKAGELLLGGLHQARTAIDTKSSVTDMVTEMDRAAEALILDHILRVRPDDGVLGEEGSHSSGTSGVRWIIDPLDGTTNYLYGYPSFCVSVAAEVDGEVGVGVVHDPSRHETFSAVRGGGSFLNETRLTVAGPPSLATALVATGFSYVAARRAWQAAVLTHVLPAARDIRRSGSAALDLCWVAAGRVDAFYEWGLQPWDVGGGGLVASEAGAVVQTLDGGPSMTDITLAGPAQLIAPLRELLAVAVERHPYRES